LSRAARWTVEGVEMQPELTIFNPELDAAKRAGV